MKIISVTNRKLCKEDFLVRIEKIAQSEPYAIILREKDMTETEYCKLAERCLEICMVNRTKLIVNSFTGIAEELGVKCIQVSYQQFLQMGKEKEKFREVWVSVHSADEAVNAEEAGSDFLVAGHIFETSCKPDFAPRGLDFLSEVCNAVRIPVYAIGGINCENSDKAGFAGADGVCIMSQLMICENPSDYIKKCKKIKGLI